MQELNQDLLHYRWTFYQLSYQGSHTYIYIYKTSFIYIYWKDMYEVVKLEN